MIAVPLVGALLAVASPWRWVRPLAVLAGAVVVGLAGVNIGATHGSPVRHALGSLPWLDDGVDRPIFGLFLDPISSVLLVVVVVIGLLALLYSTAYLGEKNREHATPPTEQRAYYFWLLLFLASMVGVALAPNFLQLFIFWELTTFCSWALISYYQSDSSLRAGFKALVMTHVGGLFFLFALLILFVDAGSFEFDALGRLSGSSRSWVFACLMIAAWAKAAQVPLHTWLPDAMEAPTPISAYLHAAAMVKAGVYLMARSVAAGWAMPSELAILLGAMALVTILVALSFYFVQDDLKRLLAYSTIAHLGYVLVGVAIGALGEIQGFRGGLLHIVCHAFSKATLFFCAGAVAYITGTRSIKALQGLGKSMPFTATAFFVGVLAVSGVPPFACFWSKFMILEGAIRLPGAMGPLLLIVLMGETLIAFGWMLYVAQKVFLGRPSLAAQVNSDPPPAMSLTLALLVIGCLAAPAVGLPLVQWIGR
jgi:hydrogenase-4 component D